MLAALSAVLGLGTGGCSTKLPFAGEMGAASVGPTGSVTAAAAAEPTAADLQLARSAAVELMTRDVKDASQSWENPRTGARGTVTPIASAYAQSGTTCRDFLASYVRGTRQSWYQGGACRNGSGWEVRDMRPLQRS